MRLLIGKSARSRRRKVKVKNSESGFTMIEACIALIVMMVAALAAASLFLYAINYNTAANDRAVAVAVAQQHLEKLRKGSFDEVVSSTESDLESAGRHFTVDTTVTGTTLKTITITVTPKSAGKSWALTPVVVISQRAASSTGTYFP
jgi:Tfp pilus assembly protein PilV